MILKEPTHICKVCFKNYIEKDLFHLLGGTNVCLKCIEELKPTFIKFKVDKYQALAIYEYNDSIKQKLYQFKGCFDIEIGDIFLNRYIKELRFKYLDYYMIPIPSFKEDDEKREFNHVIEMFKDLKLKIKPIIVKTHKVKQANSSFKQRQEISKYLKLVGGSELRNKKVLIVDDVYTSGATMEAAIRLVETLNPKKIEILVMSKTIAKQIDEDSNNTI